MDHQSSGSPSMRRCPHGERTGDGSLQRKTASRKNPGTLALQDRSKPVRKRLHSPATARGELPLGLPCFISDEGTDPAHALNCVVRGLDETGKYRRTGFERPRRCSGRRVLGTHYVTCSPSDFLRTAWAELQDPWPHAFSTCAGPSPGRYAHVSLDVESLLGRPAERLDDFFQRTLIWRRA
jgi:hypothetical protein